MKKEVWCFDLDGTLADHNGVRTPYDESKVGLDKPIIPVFKILKTLWNNEDYKVIFLSGRTEACKKDTIFWLLSNLGYNFLTIEDAVHTFDLWDVELHMRKVGDRRKDAIVKKEIYDECIAPYYNVIAVFDDRDSVCDMWVKNNIFLFNVSQGKGDF